MDVYTTVTITTEDDEGTWRTTGWRICPRAVPHLEEALTDLFGPPHGTALIDDADLRAEAHSSKAIML
jgi:hypothetical protein